MLATRRAKFMVGHSGLNSASALRIPIISLRVEVSIILPFS